MSVEPHKLIIRECPASEHAEDVLEQGAYATLWDLITATHYLRYSDRSGIDPIEKYNFFFDEAFKQISAELKSRDFYEILETVHRWVRTHFSFKASTTTSVQMLEKGIFRCATAADFIAAVLERFGFEHIDCVSFFDHKQASVRDDVNSIIIILDPNEPQLLCHQIDEFDKTSKGVREPLKILKEKKRVKLRQLLDRELGEEISSAKATPPLDTLYKHVYSRVLARLIPDSADEANTATEPFYDQGGWSRLGASVLSEAAPITPPKATVNPVNAVAKNIGALTTVVLAYATVFSIPRCQELGESFVHHEPSELQAVALIEDLCKEKPKVIWVDLRAFQPSMEVNVPMKSTPSKPTSDVRIVFNDKKLIDLNPSFSEADYMTFYPDLVQKVQSDESSKLSHVWNVILGGLVAATDLAVNRPVFFTTTKPYIVYKLEDASNPLSFEQVEKLSHFPQTCLVALDGDGKVVSVLKK